MDKFALATRSVMSLNNGKLQRRLPVAVVYPAGLGNGLGIIRSLGHEGIPVIGLDSDGLSPGFFSRYCIAMRCPSARTHERTFVDFLCALGKDLRAQGRRGVLFLMDDPYVFIATKYKDRLEQDFLFSFLGWDVLHNCVDKRRMHQMATCLGIPTPATYWPSNSEEIHHIAAEVPYPCLIKPIGKFEIRQREACRVHAFQRLHGRAIRCRDSHSLIRTFEQVSRDDFQVIIQEEVDEKIHGVYAAGAYRGRDGSIQAMFTGRKVRQIPRDFGLSTAFERVAEPLLQQYAERFLDHVGFWGLGELEFVRDPTDGTFKFLEMNPRAWRSISLATACGLNFSLIAYCDLLGTPLPMQQPSDLSITWTDTTRDILHFIQNRRSHRRPEGLTWADWLRSLSGERTELFFDSRDPLPGIGMLLNMAYSNLQTARSKLQPQQRAGS